MDSGEYLWECLKYVELNMVRCGAVGHPREWEWSGYRELMGQRRRNRLLDVDKLLELLGKPSLEDFRKRFDYAVDEMITRNEARRQDKWIESLAVGSQKFIEGIELRVRNRQQTRSVQEGNAWVLKEDYGTFFGPEK